MECPKCGGGSFLADEDFVKILEGTDPAVIVIKAIYVCRACGERFSRLFADDIANRKKPRTESHAHAPVQYQQAPNPYNYQPKEKETTPDEAAEGLKFF